MALPTAEQVTNLYLYGTQTRPGNLLDPSILAPRNGASFEVNVVEYMTTGPGRFVNSANFAIVDKFFNTPGLQPRTYTKAQIAQIFGLSSSYYGYAENQLYLGTDDPDYAERTYIWGSTKFKIAEGADFVVNPDGTREIRNFAIVPDGDNPSVTRPYGTDNFDFKGSPLSDIGNAGLESIIDPSKIGKTVDLVFTGAMPTQTLTAADFTNDKATVITAGTLDKLNPFIYSNAADKIQALTTSLFSSGSQPIRFLDADNRPIIYGSNSADMMSGYVTKGNVNLNLNQYPFKYKGYSLYFGLDSKLYPFISNGIAYVGGDGSDTIIGTDKGDALYGGEGADSLAGRAGNDYLEGGKGKDTYYFMTGDGHDTIVDDGDNVLVINNHVYAGVFRQEEGASAYTMVGDDRGYTLNFTGDGAVLTMGADSITFKNLGLGDFVFDSDGLRSMAPCFLLCN